MIDYKAVGESVAAALGAGWTSRPNGDVDNGRCYSATLSGPGGALIHLRGVNGYESARLEISGMFPRSRRGESYGPWDSKEVAQITVAANRAAAQIAAEIRRRVLPSYLPQLAEALDKQAKTEAQEREDRALADRLASLLGVQPAREDHHPLTVRLPSRGTSPYGEITVKWGLVELKVSGLTPAQAERIAAELG